MPSTAELHKIFVVCTVQQTIQCSQLLHITERICYFMASKEGGEEGSNDSSGTEGGTEDVIEVE